MDPENRGGAGLLLVDLDNTLVDRDAAFRAACTAFLADQDLPPSDLDWLMALDAGGYTARDVVAAAMADRYRGAGAAVRDLVDRGAADRVVLEPAVSQALRAADAGGWSCVIVTNGRTVQQEAKIRRTGLDRLVRGWVVSEAIGHRKPAAGIFHAAAELAGLPLRDAWVVGDSAHADIAGAVRLGLRSVWVANDRTWRQDAYRPTRIAPDGASAVRLATGSGRPAGQGRRR